MYILNRIVKGLVVIASLFVTSQVYADRNEHERYHKHDNHHQQLAQVTELGWEGTPIELAYNRKQLERFWRKRIKQFLKQDVVPLIDMESSISRDDGDLYIEQALQVMDQEGVALIAFDSKQASRIDPDSTGYRWSYYVHHLVNTYPDHFILATNGGSNNNWTQQKESYISQLEEQLQSNDYPLIGEIEFRHYMSNQQCNQGRTDRDVNIALNSNHGHRVFQAAREAGTPLLLHFELEDILLESLREMLAAYPDVKVVIAHYSQIRHPADQTRFGPGLVRELFEEYDNLYWDISVGQPNRRYACSGEYDTYLWKYSAREEQQQAILKQAYYSLFKEYSERFVSGFDYGGGRGDLGTYIQRRAENIRLIIRDLPESVQHDIAYRNAWYLLTGKKWKHKVKAKRAQEISFVDAHSQVDLEVTDLNLVIEKMDANRVGHTILSTRGGRSPSTVVALAQANPQQVTASIPTKGGDYKNDRPAYYTKLAQRVSSDNYHAIAEVLIYHAQKGDVAPEVAVPLDDPRVTTALDYARQNNWPFVIHIEFASLSEEGYEEHMQALEALLEQYPDHPFVMIHMGQLNAQSVHELIEEHHNIYFMTSHTSPVTTASSSQPWTELFNNNNRLKRKWRRLIIRHFDRFIFAIDNVWARHWLDDYEAQMAIWQDALLVLPNYTGQAVAHGNAQRLWDIPITSD